MNEELGCNTELVRNFVGQDVLPGLVRSSQSVNELHVVEQALNRWPIGFGHQKAICALYGLDPSTPERNSMSSALKNLGLRPDGLVAVPRPDKAPLAFYEGEGHVPVCLTEKLTLVQCEAFLDSDDGPVTFAVLVPLQIVVNGASAIRNHIAQTAFEPQVSIHSCEYRPVGARLGSFSDEFDGDVMLQVTCSLSRND